MNGLQEIQSVYSHGLQKERLRSQLKVNERVELNVYNKHKKQDEWIAGLFLKLIALLKGRKKYL